LYDCMQEFNNPPIWTNARVEHTSHNWVRKYEAKLEVYWNITHNQTIMKGSKGKRL